MDDLFASNNSLQDSLRPLADLLRPQSLDELVGQDHLLGPQGALSKLISSGWQGNIILWGPPGSGKTTIARLLSNQMNLYFEKASAVLSGVQDLRKIFEAAKIRFKDGQGTLLFVDEIHRFNRAQQDAFLPYLEDGTIKLIGATTENPSFELNSAVLSRSSVYTLNRLDTDALQKLIERAEKHKNTNLPATEEARQAIIRMADGDGRRLLNLCEEVFASATEGEAVDSEQLAQIVQQSVPVYDKNQDSHYNLISALHKSVRGSDPDAALYWLARMFAGGEEPLYIARRLVRMAIEDIGLADPQAIVQANAAQTAYSFLGSPEGELALAQATIYLATAPKSNASYKAFKNANKTARQSGSVPPPKIILNAPTSLMSDEGYGKGYEYDHDQPQSFSGQNYFPDGMERKQFYQPVQRGFEREIQKRLEYWQKLRGDRET